MGSPVFYLATLRKERKTMVARSSGPWKRKPESREKRKKALPKHWHLQTQAISGVGRERGEGRSNESRRGAQSAGVPQSSSLGSFFLAQDGAARDTFLALGSRGGCFRKAQAFGSSGPVSSLHLWLRAAVEFVPARRLRKRSAVPGVLPGAWESRVKDRGT